MKKRIYISGPISGTKDYMERFSSAEKKLAEEGYAVLNPAKVNAQMPEVTTYDEYMAICFAMLEMTDTIFMLHEWRNSRGAQMERRFALEKDYDILYER